MNQLSLLLMRLFFGFVMAFAHGWPKLLGFSQGASQFPDPIGFGPEVAMALAIFAELVCAVAVALGLFTRLACIPLMITMLVAAFVIHANDPFHKQEMALLFFTGYLAIFLSGSGKYSLQQVLGLVSTRRFPAFNFLLK